jgi:hypothetical protein
MFGWPLPTPTRATDFAPKRAPRLRRHTKQANNLCQAVAIICIFSIVVLQVFAAVLSSGPTRQILNASYKTADNSSFQVTFHYIYMVRLLEVLAFHSIQETPAIHAPP